eukprot:3544142-Prymnesium_polylepis.1
MGHRTAESQRSDGAAAIVTAKACKGRGARASWCERAALTVAAGGAERCQVLNEPFMRSVRAGRPQRDSPPRAHGFSGTCARSSLCCKKAAA